MTHYPNMGAAVRERLEARGIDAERSTNEFLFEVRYGPAYLRVLEGMAQHGERSRARLRRHAIPLALVLPDERTT